jgi:hypothetical protein
MKPRTEPVLKSVYYPSRFGKKVHGTDLLLTIIPEEHVRRKEALMQGYYFFYAWELS